MKKSHPPPKIRNLNFSYIIFLNIVIIANHLNTGALNDEVQSNGLTNKSYVSPLNSLFRRNVRRILSRVSNCSIEIG
jgi:hypothetical protein